MTDQHEFLPMWVVYDHPLDMPDRFVARRWLTLPNNRPTQEVLTADKLDDLRYAIQRAMPGAVRLDRSPDDDAKIMEVWL